MVEGKSPSSAFVATQEGRDLLLVLHDVLPDLGQGEPLGDLLAQSPDLLVLRFQVLLERRVVLRELLLRRAVVR